MVDVEGPGAFVRLLLGGRVGVVVGVFMVGGGEGVDVLVYGGRGFLEHEVDGGVVWGRVALDEVVDVRIVGFPSVAFRIDYWFDFQFALRMEVENSRHYYDQEPDGLSDVNLFRVLLQVKYYFDTRDLSAPITFIGPHIILGGGMYQRTDNVSSGKGDAGTANTVNAVTALGFNFGAGFELTLKPKKTYLQLEALGHLIQFGDQYNSE